MRIKNQFSSDNASFGHVLGETLQKKTSQVAKRSLMLHQFVEALRCFNMANEMGNKEEANRFFRIANDIADRYQLDEPVDVLPRLS